MDKKIEVISNETRFLIVDGNSIGFRAAMAKQKGKEDMKTISGKNTGTIYRFFSMLNRIFREVKPTHLIICFDTPGKTFRYNLDETYKANRSKTQFKEDIYNQFEDIKSILNLVGIKYDNIKGYEGDDLIASYLNNSKADKNYILSGDKDIFQLINDNTFILYPIKGISELQVYDKQKFKDRFEFDVDKYIDYKALVGDNSDNITGAKGIGEKTAVTLLEKFGSINNLVNNLQNERKDIRGWKKISKIISEWDYNKTLKLVNILKDVDVNHSFEDCLVDLKWKNAIPLLKEFEFEFMINKINGGNFFE